MNQCKTFLKGDLWQEWDKLETDQRLKIPAPPVEKPAPPNALRIALQPPEEITCGNQNLREVIAQRRSRREYTEQPLSLEELSYLLWATQGVREVLHGKTTFRTVPSAGSRHPFETYLLIQNVEGVEPGLYRYLAVSHELIWQNDFDSCCRTDRTGVQPFCREQRRDIHMDGDPLSHSLALWRSLPQVDRPGCRPCLPESLPGLRVDRCRNLCSRSL